MKGLRLTLAIAIAIGLAASSAAAVAAQDDPMEPAAVTGSSTFLEEVAGGSRAWLDGAIRGTDLVWTSNWDASDPRLSGVFTVTANRDLYERLQMQVAAGTAVVETRDGRWVGTASHLGGAALGETTTMILRGEGAHEGLTAYVVMDTEAPSFRAAIFPGDMPAFPDPVLTE